MSHHRRNDVRRAKAGDRHMDTVEKKADKQTVLLDTDALTTAVMSTTKGGKKRLDGIYLPNGQKVEGAAQKAEDTAVANQEAQQQINLTKVARTYNNAQHRVRKKAEKSKKTDEQLFDEESEKKAKAILDRAGEHEKLQFQELFNFFDVDKDRTWGSIEFAQRMTDIGCGTSVESASNLLYFAGVRDVDRITYEDFVQLMPKLKAFRRMLEKEAMKSFQARDTYGRGYIHVSKLPEVLREIAGPEGLDDEHLEQLIKVADRERTGMITFEFFIRALFGTAPLIPYEPPSRRTAFLALLCGRSRMPRDDAYEDYEMDRM